jgi:hypothetical protein
MYSDGARSRPVTCFYFWRVFRAACCCGNAYRTAADFPRPRGARFQTKRRRPTRHNRDGKWRITHGNTRTGSKSCLPVQCLSVMTAMCTILLLAWNDSDQQDLSGRMWVTARIYSRKMLGKMIAKVFLCSVLLQCIPPWFEGR